MSQPPHVPVQDTDRIRPSELLPSPRPWYLDRPAEIRDLMAPSGRRFGAPASDLGYGLKLARMLDDRLEGVDEEERGDALAGAFACGSRRAASFGRAPVIYDMEWAYTLWGYFGGAPAELVAWRDGLFKGAALDYWVQRRIADAVRPETMRLTPAQVRDRVADWKELLIV